MERRRLALLLLSCLPLALVGGYYGGEATLYLSQGVPIFDEEAAGLFGGFVALMFGLIGIGLGFIAWFVFVVVVLKVRRARFRARRKQTSSAQHAQVPCVPQVSHDSEDHRAFALAPLVVPVILMIACGGRDDGFSDRR